MNVVFQEHESTCEHLMIGCTNLIVKNLHLNFLLMSFTCSFNVPS